VAPLKRISDQEFLELAATVYAWVMVADGSTNREEITGFINYLESLPYVDQISEGDFSSIFLDTVSLFQNDYQEAKKDASKRLQKVSSEIEVAKDLVRVARRALISDEEITELEENALAEISELLNIDEGQLD